MIFPIIFFEAAMSVRSTTGNGGNFVQIPPVGKPSSALKIEEEENKGVISGNVGKTRSQVYLPHPKVSHQQFNDRFIPSRSAMTTAGSGVYGAASELRSPQNDFDMEVLDALSLQFSRTVMLTSKPKTYKVPAKPEVRWKFPANPERVLDAPDLNPDFYYNEMDWGPESLIGLNLGKAAYVWNKVTGQATEAGTHENMLTSIRWNPLNPIFAVGDEGATLTLTDAVAQKKLLSFSSDNGSSILSIAWRTPNELTLGAENGGIYHCDIRMPKMGSRVQTSLNNKIPSVEWNSKDISMLAAGSNDRYVRIFDLRRFTQPSFSYTHDAAIKALKWVPDEPALLLSGGGELDRRIQLMDVGQQKLLSKQEVGAQVCSAVFMDKRYFVLGLGPSQDANVQCWRYVPNSKKLEKFADVFKDPGRILNLAKDLNGSEFCALSSAESITFFLPITKAKTKSEKAKSSLHIDTLH